MIPTVVISFLCILCRSVFFLWICYTMGGGRCKYLISVRRRAMAPTAPPLPFLLLLLASQTHSFLFPATSISRSRNISPATDAKDDAVPFSGPGLDVPRNVLGGELQCCCSDVGGSGIGTGFYRDGFCSTGVDDQGRHTVCLQATAEFLEFSASVGNDLSTPMPQWSFPGVRPGDQWCLCAERWVQAFRAGKAPKLWLKATHEKTLQHVPLEILLEYGCDKEEATAEQDRLDAMRAQLQKSVAVAATGEEPKSQ